MAQLQLPFTEGYTAVNALVGFQKRDGWIYYFHGSLAVYSRTEDDYDRFCFITSELVMSGNVKQSDIIRAFGVSKKIRRNLKRLRDGGIRGLLRPHRGGTTHVLSPEKLRRVQFHLDQGLSATEAGRRVALSGDTIRKAIDPGLLAVLEKDIVPAPVDRHSPSAHRR